MSQKDHLAIRDVASLTTLAHSYRQWHTLRVAIVHFDVFTRLAGGPRTWQQLMTETGASQRGARILLDALTAMELLEKDGDSYRNSPLAQRHLVRTSPDSQCNSWELYEFFNENFMHAAVAVRDGMVPPELRSRHPYKDEQIGRVRARAMYELGKALAQEFAEGYDLSFARRMVDLGGAPGAYSFAFCRANAQLEATVVDLPSPVEVTREMAQNHGLADRVHTVVGDIFAQPPIDLGSGYDLALISNVLHLEGPEADADLIKRARASLVPGGRLVIHDRVLDDTRTRPADLAVQAMQSLIINERGNSYTLGEFAGWLAQAGLSIERTITFPNRVTTWIVSRAGQQ
ncbi:MAG: hypothetical protein HYY01_07270 [Chloroflexi bacterium]|nr:hypothetical protein [Chloroflexota bacterium]